MPAIPNLTARHLQPQQEDWIPYLFHYDKLPGFLYPHVGYRQQPPIYHCGWVVEDEWVYNYAKEHGVTEVIIPDEDENDEYDSGPEPGDLFDEENRWISPGLTVSNVCREVQRCAGLDATATLQLRCKIVYWKDMSHSMTCFSICTNYDKPYRLLLKAPDMRKIRKELGRPDNPKWHLDWMESEWDDGRRAY